MKPEQLRPSAELAHMGSWIRTGNTELKVHLLFFPPPSSYHLFAPALPFFLPPHPFSCVRNWASLQLSSWLIKDVRVTARTCTVQNNVSGWRVCCVSVFFQVRKSHMAYCLVLTAVTMCVLMWASWNPRVGWHSVCVNVGCYLFFGIGWVSCLRPDGYSVSAPPIQLFWSTQSGPEDLWF